MRGLTMLPRLYRRLRCALLRTRIAQLELAVFNAAIDPAIHSTQHTAIW